MRLYHVPNSSSQRVLWLLEETGEPYELTILGDRASRVADPAHMARHPMGRVPVLEDDDGRFLFEGVALCLQIADLYPDAGLIPPVGTHERGLVYQWTSFAITEIQTRVGVIRMSGESAPAVAETARASLLEALGVIERELEGKDNLVGDSFTVADLLVTATAGSVRRFGIAELPPALSAYVDRMEARPARKRAEERNPA